MELISIGFLGLVAKLDVHEAYAPVQSVRIVILTTIAVLVSLGVMASLALAKVREEHMFYSFNEQA